MREERLLMKGMLKDLEGKEKKLDLEAAGLIILIRMKITPHETDVTKLNLEAAATSLSRLVDIREELLGIREKIKHLKEDLYE